MNDKKLNKMKNLEGKHAINDNWLNMRGITIETIKQLVLDNHNDMILGEKVRELLHHPSNTSEPNNIFGKITGDKYKELITGHQQKKGKEYTEWYEKLSNEEKVFLSDLFD